MIYVAILYRMMLAKLLASVDYFSLLICFLLNCFGSWFDFAQFTPEAVINVLHSLSASSVSYQLTGQKSNPIFLPVKIPYRTHSMLNTTSILHGILQ